MNDIDLKSYISKLTNVDLVYRTAMADVAGSIAIRNRKLQWKPYIGNDETLPPEMNREISNLVNSFSNGFHQLSDPKFQNTKMIFVYYASDPAVNEDYLKVIKNSNDPRKNQFLTLIDWLNNNGARLWLSAKGIALHKRDKNSNILEDSNNTSNKWLETYGYIWGLKKKGDYRNVRSAHFLGDEKANDPSVIQRVSQNKQKIVKVVTLAKNNGYGIYFTDGNSVYPVIGDNYYAAARTNENSKELVDPAIFARSKGQFSKFFGIREGGMVNKIIPTQSKFAIINNKIIYVPKTSWKDTRSQGLQLFTLTIKEDGTLWWEPEKGDKLIPLSREQADAFNLQKDQYYVLSNPDTQVYSWDTLPEDTQEEVQEKEAKIQDWKQKTEQLDELYDFLLAKSAELNKEPPHVALNAFKYAIIGPRFTNAYNINPGETVGKMRAPEHFKENLNPMGDQFIAKRGEWITVGNEFNQAKAENSGGKRNAAQSIDGLGAISGFKTVQDAINKCFSTWNINCEKPDNTTLAQAQEAFIAATVEKIPNTPNETNIPNKQNGDNINNTSPALKENKTIPTNTEDTTKIKEEPTAINDDLDESKLASKKFSFYKESQEIINKIKKAN
jgi:hypothetical protein